MPSGYSAPCTVNFSKVCEQKQNSNDTIKDWIYRDSKHCISSVLAAVSQVIPSKHCTIPISPPNCESSGFMPRKQHFLRLCNVKAGDLCNVNLFLHLCHALQEDIRKALMMHKCVFLLLYHCADDLMKESPVPTSHFWGISFHQSAGNEARKLFCMEPRTWALLSSLECLPLLWCHFIVICWPKLNFLLLFTGSWICTVYLRGYSFVLHIFKRFIEPVNTNNYATSNHAILCYSYNNSMRQLLCLFLFNRWKKWNLNK